MKKTAAIFLTYKDRHRYFSPLIDRLLSMKIYYIIIVDNHASDESKKVIAGYKRKHQDRIHIIANEKNVGTALGFTQGIQRAIELGAEYLWLLDDDLMPEKDALVHLFKVWESIGDTNKKRYVMLQSNRIEKKIYWQAYAHKKPHIIIGDKNQFRYLHIFHIIDKIKVRFVYKQCSPEFLQQTKMKDFAPINAACYGGMFFHKDLIYRVGYPDERYVVYMDDFDFSYRNILKGGIIYFVPFSVLRDQEDSWNNAKKTFAFIQIAINNNYSVLYYSIRNRIYFELKYNVDNCVIYAINLLVYSIVVTLYALVMFKWKNIVTYAHAVRDGLIKNMGINYHYPL